MLGSDLFFYSFIVSLSMQFEILSEQLQELKAHESNKVILGELIERHKTLIRLSDNVDKIFSISILANFLASSVFICLLAYQAAIETNAENILKYSIILLISLLQVFNICYHGSKLTSASEKVADSAYSSGWNGWRELQAEECFVDFNAKISKAYIHHSFQVFSRVT